MQIEQLAPVIFISAFVLFWCGMCFCIAKVGGWNKLVKKYSAIGLPTGATMFRFQNLKLGMSSYSGCMNIAISGRGLYLVPILLFRFGHQPVLIPWSSFIAVSKESFLFVEYGILTIQAESDIHFQISRKVLQEIEKRGYLNSLLPRMA